MKKIIPFFVLLIIFSTFQCNRNYKPTSIQPTSISLKSLTAINLSEDMNEVSTHEDEIFLLVFLVEKQDTGHQILSEWSHFYTFKKRNETAPLSLNIPLDHSFQNADQLLFFLTELDNKNPEQQITNLLKETIKQTNSFKNLDKSQLDKKLGHDDFLGLQYLEIKKLNTSTDNLLQFKGLQLFDRFEYHLKIAF